MGPNGNIYIIGICICHKSSLVGFGFGGFLLFVVVAVVFPRELVVDICQHNTGVSPPH